MRFLWQCREQTCRPLQPRRLETTGTACHHLRMEQVLRSGGAGDSSSELPLDMGELYRRQNELMGLTQLASSSKVPSIQMTSDGQ